jgi:hypothetical protein
LTRHLIQAAESLKSIAATYQLSGWQGLYFAQSNTAFRQQFPSPWAIPEGVEIAIPQSEQEQQAALILRQTQLKTTEQRVNQLAEKQRRLLLAPFGSTEASDAPAMVTTVVWSVTSTTAEAISVLKTSDWHGGHRDLDLLNDALARWDLDDSGAAASLLSLLTRAARPVHWSVPAASAQAWCDPSFPQFWAKPLILGNLPNAYADSARQRTSVGALLRAQHLAVEQVIRQLRSLRTEAIMESNHLARLTNGTE